MQLGDGAQQTVLRSVQLPLCSIGGAVWGRDGVIAPAGALLPLRPVQGSHRGGAPALRSTCPGEAGDGCGGMQM